VLAFRLDSFAIGAGRDAGPPVRQLQATFTTVRRACHRPGV